MLVLPWSVLPKALQIVRCWVDTGWVELTTMVLLLS